MKRAALPVGILMLLTACRHESANIPPIPAVSPKTASAAHAHTNHLALEKSPYLLQHAHNPVDWHAWGDEAFQKARAEDKPIFLSIGYSTCHWCHVMERESFENTNTAAYLNEHFISIKVDREERPDVDKIYMTFVQAMTGAGGWPLNVFITPDLKPFYGGTYWPPEQRQGRPSFLTVLQQIHTAWTGKREQLTNSSATMHAKLMELTARPGATNEILTPAVLLNAGRELKEGYDARNGGWGRAPKFPSPSHPAFVLRHAVRTQDAEAMEMFLHTCERMAAGGIYDQLGGGFSRYSVDEKWLVPHFEKMLYDNAQLLGLYLDAYLVSGNASFASVARDILRYLLRDMRHPDGGFYSAEDADSEGKEGKFYCWTLEEMKQLLTPPELEAAVRIYGVTRDGNFVDHSDPDPLPRQNVLSLVRTNLTPAEEPLLRSAREKLFAARAKRVRPHLDDKILSSWNGLLLGSLARAASILDDDSYREAAIRNASFLRAKLWDSKTKTLFHRWRDGARDSVQLVDAYACLLYGMVELYQATLDPEHLSFAIDIADAMLGKFHDANDGGFWQSPAGSTDLILRVKEDYDGAEPSANSVAIYALLKLAAITERQEYRAAADKSLRLFAGRLQQMPQAVPHMLMALDFAMTEPHRVVIAGDLHSAEARALLRAAHSVYQPHKVVLGVTGLVEPFAKSLVAKDGRATAYVCTGLACKPPTHDPDAVKGFLK
ncbi:MAG: uncharacterized protein QOF48_608 [Verrucomicrobiota bacterium]